MISVLICSRGRPHLLCRALDSLFSMAHDQSAVEVLVKVDDDDPQTQELLARLGNVIPVHAVVSPRGNGYRDIHLWLADLARQAGGDWLFVFTDDAVVKTPGWEQYVLAPQLNGRAIDWHGWDMTGGDDVALVLPKNLSRPGSHEWFFLHRRVFEVLGHMGKSPHADTYLITIMLLLQQAWTANIDIQLADNPESDATSQARMAVTSQTMLELRSPAMIRSKLTDCVTLLGSMWGSASAQVR